MNNDIKNRPIFTGCHLYFSNPKYIDIFGLEVRNFKTMMAISEATDTDKIDLMRGAYHAGYSSWTPSWTDSDFIRVYRD